MKVLIRLLVCVCLTVPMFGCPAEQGSQNTNEMDSGDGGGEMPTGHEEVPDEDGGGDTAPAPGPTE